MTSVLSTARSATTRVTTEVNLLEATIADAGVYLFVADIPINYYRQTGRDLLIRLKVNNSNILTIGGNSNADYTIHSSLITMAEIPDNANIKITIQDTSGKTYACTQFILKYIRLR